MVDLIELGVETGVRFKDPQLHYLLLSFYIFLKTQGFNGFQMDERVGVE